MVSEKFKKKTRKIVTEAPKSQIDVAGYVPVTVVRRSNRSHFDEPRRDELSPAKFS